MCLWLPVVSSLQGQFPPQKTPPPPTNLKICPASERGTQVGDRHQITDTLIDGNRSIMGGQTAVEKVMDANQHLYKYVNNVHYISQDSDTNEFLLKHAQSNKKCQENDKNRT